MQVYVSSTFRGRCFLHTTKKVHLTNSSMTRSAYAMEYRIIVRIPPCGTPPVLKQIKPTSLDGEDLTLIS